MVRRHELTDDEWTALEPLLPPQKPPLGKPNRPHRVVLDGIFWRIRTGAPWRDLPESYGVVFFGEDYVTVHMVEFGYGGPIRVEGSPDYQDWNRETMVR